MKYLSLIPALWIFLLSPLNIFAANIKVDFVEKTEYYVFKVSLSGLDKTTCKDKTCYLQGMFTSSSGSPKYFGYTFGQADWFAYQSSPEKDFIKSNFVPFETSSEGTWEGLIRLLPDKEDSDYKGPGEYLVKVKRYTGEGSSAASDEIQTASISLTETTPTESPSPTDTITPTATPTPTPTPTTTLTPSSTPTLRNTPTTVTSTKTPTQVITPKNNSTTTPSITRESVQTSKTSNSTESSNPYDLLTDISENNLETAPDSTPSSVLGDNTTKKSDTNRYKTISLVGLIILGISGPLLYLRLGGVKIY